MSNILNIIVDPIVQTGILAAVGALITRVLLRHHPKRRLIGQLGFFLALTALLLYHGIIPYKSGPSGAPVLQRVSIAIAKIIWWTNAAWSLISIVRVFLIIERQPNEVRLLQDLIVGVIYVGAILSVIAYVFDAPVGTLIATSGAIAIVLGLALQSTLSDVFSGIALNLARPYGIGDWLVLGDGFEGKVVETNWRATHLVTGANDLIIVPNSDLAKARLTNLSSPARSHGVTLTVRFRPTTLPSAMVEVMDSVLINSNSILMDPQPSAQVTSLDANAAQLELTFSVADVRLVGKARTEIFDLIYRHAKASGLVLAQPPEAAGAAIVATTDDASAFAQHSTPRRLLDAITLFASLTDDEKEALTSTMVRRTFRKEEILVEQGAVLNSLMIIRNGIVAITRREEARLTELVRLAPGEFFGEAGLLTGAGEFGTIKALTFVVVYEITQESLAGLMRDRPAICEELGSMLSKRAATELVRLNEYHDDAGSKSAPRLTARIRQLFNI
ncbi:small-conductance mechanosensitive channel [Mycoplana sp. BE70]|uniref:mechanosensitive ion channel family protein n=1 Tax=Mycoplana sp. BE70 TaxID=2817775 RepID=UPI002867913C|nr:mechanosensitive ion channel family protein [Mycoplana sp. BE70]MDR6759426.1 small-conductance mechanosensitive channel [Mycoplana sp. BE70]